MSGSRHISSAAEGSFAGIVDVGPVERPYSCRPAANAPTSDQDTSIGKKRGGVLVSRHRHVLCGAECLRGWIVQFAKASGLSINVSTARDEDLAVRQQSAGGLEPLRWASRRFECARRGIVELSSNGWSRIVITGN